MLGSKTSSIKCSLIVGSCLVILGLVASQAFGNPADLDTTFGKNGVVVDDLAFSGGGGRIALQRNGKIVIVAVAQGPAIFLTRLTAAGKLDDSFAGTKTIQFEAPDGFSDASVVLQAVAVQPDDKIVAVVQICGSVDVNDTRCQTIVARFMSDGARDVGFGNEDNGTVYVPIGSSVLTSGLGLQKDGKIVVAGYMLFPTPNPLPFVFRLNSHGCLDKTFGADRNGVVTGDPFLNSSFASYSSVAIQTDGRIVVGGSSITAGQGNDLGAVLLSTFGDIEGAITTDFGDPTITRAMALQTDGRIVVVGQQYFDALNARLAIVRYCPALALGPMPTPNPAPTPVLSPCSNSGSLDLAFGPGGYFSKRFPGFGYFDPKAVAIQSNDKILVAGSAGFSAFVPRFGLLRFKGKNGKRDKSFGGRGYTTTEFGSGFSAHSDPTAMVIQSDGKILVLGDIVKQAGGLQMGLVRYIGDPVAP